MGIIVFLVLIFVMDICGVVHLTKMIVFTAPGARFGNRRPANVMMREELEYEDIELQNDISLIQQLEIHRPSID
jgi:hypothetical protein